MTAARSVKSRFALLTAGRLIFGCAALYRAVETYQSSSDSALPLASLGFLALAVILLWWSAIGFVALFRSSSEPADSFIESSVANVDSRAPSGLKPLWIGLGLVIGVFILWILLSKLLDAA
jgi:hypothetical protein